MKAQDSKINAVEMFEVDNQNPKPAAAKKYIPALAILNGRKTELLFTKHDIQDAMERAKKNPEDCPEESFWSKWFK